MNKYLNLTRLRKAIFFIPVIILIFSFKEPTDTFRSFIDLSGYWQFSLDSAAIGIKQNWYLSHLPDSIKLPGTTDSNQKGHVHKTMSTSHLNRPYTYEGAAWYKKDILIPKEWKDKHIELVLERTKPTKLWIDGHFIGESILLESPQKYNLSNFLAPGKHTITIQVNNNINLTPYGNVHIYSEDTQTNWNGIIGTFCLEASDKNHIKDLQIYPDIAEKKINVLMSVENPRNLDNIDVEIQITKGLNHTCTKLKPAKYKVPGDSIIRLEYILGKETDLWDEYSQPIYYLNAIISSKGKIKDNKRVSFGMRSFTVKGTHFSINGRTSFLRGKHDACVFPLTGYPPMDTAGWIRVFKIAKSYGINHYRFHTWSPPDAAFTAADKLGMYLQPELPFWGGLDSDTIAAQLTAEGKALLKNFGNHPSFVMFGPGNEIWSGLDRVEKIITELKNADNRHLYSGGSNNQIGYSAPMPIEDYHVAARTPYAHDTILTHVRLSHGFVDSKDGGILNTQLPSSTVNYQYSVSQIKIPLVSHEIGQYQIFPDYKEIDKYTGVLKASNLEEFRNRLQKAGMFDQNHAFAKASGALAAMCYRAEIEAALRTKGLAGFHLLDLQDYPGQGTALTGILDAFMDSKHVITREEWIQFCNDVVPLLSYEKYCLTPKETFKATIQVANYSNKAIKKSLLWSIKDGHHTTIKNGSFDNINIPNDGLNVLGNIEIPLNELKVPDQLTITLKIEGSDYKNSYPLWIYPEPHDEEADSSILITQEINKEIINKLKNGKNVFLMPSAESVKENSIPGLFHPDFWNYGMFKGISEWAKKPVSPGTLGILTNPKHPIFNSFPTDFYTNWQWWTILKNSNPLILDQTTKDYRPIVQVIDNIERNHKLGLIFEFKLGKGKLLVCMARLNKIQDYTEANQLYHSIISYMKSDQFKPDFNIEETELKKLLQ